MSSPILVTGSAGFIGYHLCQRLLSDGFDVIGLDAMTDYYDVSLKERRLALLKAHKGFTPVIARLEAPKVMENLLAMHKPRMIVHLAAQAGVRYSIDAPRSYVRWIRKCLSMPPPKRRPRQWRRPMRISTLFRQRCFASLRSMALGGALIEDLVDAVRRLMDAVPGDTPVSAADNLSPIAPWRAVNIGNGAPTKLTDFIEALEEVLGKQAQKNMLDIQPGDMPSTWADATLMQDPHIAHPMQYAVHSSVHCGQRPAKAPSAPGAFANKICAARHIDLILRQAQDADQQGSSLL